MEFNLLSPVFSILRQPPPNTNFSRIADDILQDFIDIINTSALFQSLLEAFQGTGKHIYYDPNATSAVYDPETGNITVKDITGDEFVRLLSHELGHFHRDATDTDTRFAGIIDDEMDESQATAMSYIIRRQILLANGPDIGISNKIGKFSTIDDAEGNDTGWLQAISDLDLAFGSQVNAGLTAANVGVLLQSVAEKIWGKNFLTRPRGISRWQMWLESAYGTAIPVFLQTSERKFKSAEMQENGQYKFIFTDSDSQEITWIYEATTGGDGRDLVTGKERAGSNDILSGGGGDDIIYGGWNEEDLGNDTLYGDDGDDKLYGGAGTDNLYGGADDDELNGGNNNDQLYGDAGDDELFGGLDDDNLYGGTGDDELQGNENDDKLYGGEDNDNLHGNAGNDKLFGDEGIDTLYGGEGNDDFFEGEQDGSSDRLEGDDGYDTYFYQTGDGLDTISDSDAEGRVIYDGSQLTGAEKEQNVSPGRWEVGDTIYSWAGNGSNLTITKGGNASDGVVIENFDNGDLGIRLDKKKKPEPPEPPFDPQPVAQAEITVQTSPIVIDLDNDGVESLSVDAGINFDHNGDGFAEQTGWASPDDGMLVLDKNANGDIDNGNELFGDNTVLSNGRRAANGFQALAEYDANRDGLIDSSDSIFSELRVWKDIDSDAHVDAGELNTLADVGLKAINLNYLNANIVDANGTMHKQIGTFIKNDDTSGAIEDLWYEINYSDSEPLSTLPVPEAVQDLANLHGRGTLYSLHQAIVRDQGGILKNLVQQFTVEASVSERNKILEKIMYQWADCADVAPDSRGGSIDARKLIFIERYLGRGYQGVPGGNPNRNAAFILEAVYNSLFESFYAQLVAQTAMSEMYCTIRWQFDTESAGIIADLSGASQLLHQKIVDDPDNAMVALSEFTRMLKGLKLNQTPSFATFRDSFITLGSEVMSTIDSAGREQVNGDVGNDSNNLIGLVLNLDLAVDGADGNDQVAGFQGNDFLSGGNGNDYLYGRVGNDIYSGDRGDDYIVDDSGNDTYRFNIGDGNDTIIDYGNTASGIDTVEFGLGITKNNIVLTLDNNDLLILINGGQDSLRIREWRTPTSRIERFKFTDGSILTLEEIIANGYVINGDVGNDSLVGTESADHIHASGGNDEAYGASGNDELYGGDGGDRLFGDAGDDILSGGSGYDYLKGGRGNDVYRFNLGDGQDVIDNIAETAQSDSIEFGQGITVNSLALSKAGDDLIISIAGTNDSVRLFRWFYGDNAYRVSTIKFSDSSTLSAAELEGLGYTVVPGAQNLSGTEAVDTLVGSSGDDSLNGNGGDDTLDGGSGADVLYGGYGNDVYLFNRGSGQDTVSNYSREPDSVDTIQFGPDISSSDLEYFRVGQDLRIHIAGTDDSVQVWGWFYGEDYKVAQLRFQDGSVISSADIDSGGFQIVGGNLYDRLQGSAAADNMHGWSDSDYLTGGAGNDILHGNEGNDTLNGDDGNDTLIGGSGSDTMRGGLGDDVYVFNRGDGHDIIEDLEPEGASPAGIDTLKFGSGISLNDLDFFNERGDLRIVIRDTADSILIKGWLPASSNHSRVERFEFSDGTILTPAEIDAFGYTSYGSMQGDNRLATLHGSDFKDRIYGFAGADVLYGQAEDDYLDGGSGQDYLNGGTGNDVLQGGADADSLYGDAGDDVLDGGSGDDYMKGESGNDVYKFGIGSGHDTVDVYDNTGGRDIIEVGSGISKESITLGVSYNNLLISFAGISDSLAIQNGFTDSYDLRFSDGSTMTLADFNAIGYKINGTAGNDTLTGTAYKDEIDGGAGQDSISGGEGDDQLKGGAGNDGLSGDSGNDILNGGSGNDYLVGGTGNDTYIFDLGSGIDSINNLDESIGRVDVVEFGAGLTKENMGLVKSGRDLRISFAGTDDVLVVMNWFSGSSFRIDQFRFADGSIMTQEDLNAKGYLVIGTSGNDNISGTEYNDVLDGGSGNDFMSGGSGNDTYKFGIGSGIDTINNYDVSIGRVDIVEFESGISKDDIVLEKTGNDLRISFTGIADILTIQSWFSSDAWHVDQFRFADGSILTPADFAARGYRVVGSAGNDTLFGTENNEIFYGGAGNDYLEGRAGNDIYIFNRGDGQDTIYDYSPEGGNIDTIRFGAGITQNDIEFARNGNDVIITIKGTEDSIRLQASQFGFIWEIERFEFADGSVLLPSDIIYTIKGSPDADTITGREDNEYIAGLGGDDIIQAASGNDIIDGGAGNDSLYGQQGNDSYLFGRGDGNDTIIDPWENPAARNSIQFKSGITAGDVEFERAANDLIIRIKDSGDTVRIVDWLTNPDRFAFALSDGTPVGIGGYVAYGTNGDDSINMSYGFGDDIVHGYAGNDTLSLGIGNDVYFGGAGNDYMSDAAGDDSYEFNLGDGADIIWDRAGTGDSLRFGPGITPNDLLIAQSGFDLNIQIRYTTDQITLADWYSLDENTQIDRLEFADQSILTAAQFAPPATNQTLGIDEFILNRSTEDNVYVTADGNDNIRDRAGNDSYNTGLGNDIIDDREGNDTYNMGDGDDSVMDEIGDDNYLLGDGSDNTTDGFGNDVYRGGAGNDSLTDAGGSDTYYYEQGDGSDFITDSATDDSEVDIFHFGSGITLADITVTRDTANLMIGISGTEDVITFTDWFNGNRIEQFTFTNGTTMTAAEATGLAAFRGTDGDDILYGTVGSDTIYGYGGIDTIESDLGDDTIIGGAGDDLITDIGGNDTYVFNVGDGMDTVSDESGTMDAVRFGPGISTGNLVFTRDSYDLVVEIPSSGDTLRIVNAFGGNAIEQFEFADGSTLSGSDALQLAFVRGTTGSDYLTGTSDAERFDAGLGDDTIIGMEGNDYYLCGKGNDSIDDSFGDETYIFNKGDGQDTIFDTDGVDTVVFGTGLSAANLKVSQESADLIISFTGSTDLLRIQGWCDGSSLSLIEDFVFADGTTMTADEIHAMAVIRGTSGADDLTGSMINDVFDGGAGADTMTGYAGDDKYYVDNAGDVVVENPDEGYDTVSSKVTYTLSADVEELILTGTSNINGTGNWNDNVLTGNSGNNTLDGKEGIDQLIGGLGNDTYVVDSEYDIVVENAGEGTDTVRSTVSYVLTDNLEKLTLIGTDSINGTGNDLDNVLTGNSYDNELDGGLGADTMIGGAGNDNYVVDNTGDIVTESSNGGNDYVRSSITYSLGSNVECLFLTEGNIIDGTGNTLNNILVGNSSTNVLTGLAGNDELYGGLGADTMIGGAGNDLYEVEDVGDVVIENASEGTDTVVSTISYTLGTNVENLTLGDNVPLDGIGNELNNVLLGNPGVNVLSGLAGNDTLDGGEGTDTLIGGIGNDTYIVDTDGDIVVENAGEGTDLVKSYCDYTLSENVENLTLMGENPINGIGNTLNNVITGNASANVLTGLGGNDTLNGGADADTMIGGIGNDTYVVDNVGDVVTENAGEGTDVVQSSITYSLADNVENLTLTGTNATDGTGNALNNSITGNASANILTGLAGNDTLNGGAGADTMIGGIGNDTYVVDNVGDVVIENAGEGTDVVQSSITYSLVDNVENLTLTGTNAIDGTGNALNNSITGNSAANVLSGLAGNDTLTGNAGNDTLNGGIGNDTLIGGTGNDTYIFNSGYGSDTISENDATAGNSDTVQFGFNPLDLILNKSGNNLEIQVNNSTDKITVQNWYLGSAYHTEVFKTADGKQLLDTQVDQLIQAMASFCSENGMTWSQAIQQKPTETQAVLATYWQAA